MSNPFAAKASPLPDTDLNPRRDPALDFEDRPFGELTAADYAAIGFMCGLEVHQQLLTRRKLFCRCPPPASASRRLPDAEVIRHMRPTLSELGSYDGCALMEFKTRKDIHYFLDRDSACTYELDDTPPFPIDHEAVRIALEMSRMFDLKLVSELHVMRKQYLDGSIPTGFQRTAMVGVGGSIPFHASELGRDRELRIRQLTLEEDSCRELSDHGHIIHFRTDRLGIPLIETVTEPDLLTPGDVERGARLLAAVHRASRKVRRGAGSARQDVNVSVAGGRRVELKGVPSYRVLPRLVHNEAFRQLNLLRIRDQLHRRGVTAEALEPPLHGEPWEVSDLVTRLEGLLGIHAIDDDGGGEHGPIAVCAVRLPGYAGILGHPTQPGKTFAREFADRVRVIACLTSPMLTVDPASRDIEQPLPARARRDIRKAAGADDDDDVVLVWGPEEDVATATREILTRASEGCIGVIAETRQAFADGTTGFERLLPGPQRMYPDTDTPPLPIPDAWIGEIEAQLAEPTWRRANRYTRAGLDDPAATRLAAAPWADLFDELAPRLPATARRLAAALDKRLVHHWRLTRTRILPPPRRLAPLIAATDDGALHPSGFETVFDQLLADEFDPAAIVKRHALAPNPGEGIESVVAAARTRLGELRATDTGARRRWAMGLMMNAAPRGQLDPAAVAARLDDVLTPAARTDGGHP